ncbi:right-handed parallel beta-helix repeat-containing protein [Fictibacillus sp. WQ 8-8]|uniref:right-handed parallel beta-helix repeat-containing protein n=1 Tax=Fictibacillus sp. WQ 8-8 TaxID=2938788 RepID=UPI00210C1C36|nr:right-handed parallel beta-helix repeat-containing protein [Fictibacillus sp. WQ 8-8]MCQ6264719.1 right-handed parallel beta-helix repeat-containing protein [Fictibacillus sp. WQ 8-8]
MNELLVKLEYVKDRVDPIKDLDLTRLEKAKENLLGNDYVISIMGAMKSGKSTFINALLGADLMPNENEACTLTTTEIVLGDQANHIEKRFEGGSSEIIQGPELAAEFLKEVRKSRREKINKHFTYHLSHPLYSLDIKDGISEKSLIIMDTPGINEMENAGADKEVIMSSFRRSVFRTDLLVYVIDYQYFKAEENEMILNLIKELRPQLLKKAVFVINKIDKHGHKDHSIEQVTEDVRSALQYWGIEDPELFPVSAKKALLGRVLKADPEDAEYKSQIDPYLKVSEIEIGGVLCAVKAHTEEAYEEVVQESGIKRFEKEVLLDSHDHFGSLQEKKQIDRVKENIDEVVEQLDQKKMEMKERFALLQKAADQLKGQSRSLEKLMDHNLKRFEEANVYLKNKSQLEKLLPTDMLVPEIPSLHVESDKIKYKSEYSAERAAGSILERALKSVYAKTASSIYDHYSKELMSNSTHQFYYAVIENMKKKTKIINQMLEKYNNEFQGNLQPLNEEFFFSPGHISNSQSTASALGFNEKKLKRFTRKIKLHTHTKTVTEYVLLFFPTTSYKYTYSQDFSNVIKDFKDIFANDVDDYNQALYRKVNRIKYEDFPEVLSGIFAQKVKDSNVQIKERYLQIGKKINKIEHQQKRIKEHLIEVTLLSRLLRERTDFITLSNTVFPESLDITEQLLKSKPGATIVLSKGVYEIKGNLKLNKPIFIKGNGADTVIYCYGSITLPEAHCFMMEGVVFIQHNDQSIELNNQLYISLSDCVFERSSILISGSPLGSIHACSFLNSKTALEMDTSDLMAIESSRFEKNEIGIKLINQSGTRILNNYFRHQKYGIVSSGFSRADISDNEFENHHNAAVWSINNASPYIKNNRFSNNHKALIFDDRASGTAFKNTFDGNYDGILLLGEASPVIKKNRIESSLNNGIRVEDHAVANITQNHITGCHSSGLQMSHNSKIVKLNGNFLSHNQAHGISVDDQVNGQILKNHCTHNQKSGIHVNSSEEFHVLYNQLENNEEQGVFLSGNGVYRVSQNSCLENNSGIEVNGDSFVTLEKNDSNHNRMYGITLHRLNRAKIAGNVSEQNGLLSVYFKTGFNAKMADNQFEEKRFAVFYARYWIMKMRRFQSHRIYKKGIRK